MLTSGQRASGRTPAAIGAGDLEVVAVHVDRMVRHGQVAHTHADAIVFGDDERTDAWEDAAVPRPQVEVGHLHNARHIRTGFDVICVYEEGKVPIHGHKLRVFGVNDEHSHHAHRHLHHLVGMRVVHERARLHEIELVDESLPDRDVWLRKSPNPIHSGRENHSVPVDGCMLRKLVGDEDADAITFDRLDGRTRGLAVIAPEVRCHAFGHLALDGLCNEMELL